MHDFSTTARHLLIIDDDLLSREVLALLTSHAGYTVTPVPSGEAALELLDAERPCEHGLPAVILTDMQMPGLAGDSLARRLRAACPGAIVVSMSATRPPPEALLLFDAFLLKPFTAEEFEAVIEGIQPPQQDGQTAEARQILNRSIYDNLVQSMSAAQLQALYAMCLDDADNRIELMRSAVAAGDSTAFIRGAHSIKGGCGMVGASELADIASAMEVDGLAPVGNEAPLERLDQFLAASQRLRRMLDAQTDSSVGNDHA